MRRSRALLPDGVIKDIDSIRDQFMREDQAGEIGSRREVSRTSATLWSRSTKASAISLSMITTSDAPAWRSNSARGLFAPVTAILSFGLRECAIKVIESLRSDSSVVTTSALAWSMRARSSARLSTPASPCTTR